MQPNKFQIAVGAGEVGIHNKPLAVAVVVVSTRVGDFVYLLQMGNEKIRAILWCDEDEYERNRNNEQRTTAFPNYRHTHRCAAPHDCDVLFEFQ